MDDFFGFKLFSCYPLPGACVTLLCDIRWLACPAVLPACRIHIYIRVRFDLLVYIYSSVEVVDYPILLSLIFRRVPCLVLGSYFQHAGSTHIGNRRENTNLSLKFVSTNADTSYQIRAGVSAGAASEQTSGVCFCLVFCFVLVPRVPEGMYDMGALHTFWLLVEIYIRIRLHIEDVTTLGIDT